VEKTNNLFVYFHKLSPKQLLFVARNWLGKFFFELYQIMMNFIKGNQMMVIKDKRTHIKFKFVNVCNKAESNFWKILN